MKRTEQAGVLASRELWLQQMHVDFKKLNSAGVIRLLL